MPGIAQQQIVACHQHDEDADPRRCFQRTHAGEQERRQRQAKQDGSSKPVRIRERGRSPEIRFVSIYFAFTTGIMPCGRHIRMAVISAMLEISASLGSRKAM
jgi:hypothetical protein